MSLREPEADEGPDRGGGPMLVGGLVSFCKNNEQAGAQQNDADGELHHVMRIH